MSCLRVLPLACAATCESTLYEGEILCRSRMTSCESGIRPCVLVPVQVRLFQSQMDPIERFLPAPRYSHSSRMHSDPVTRECGD